MFMQENILREEMEFPKLFASWEEKEYGILFYDMEDDESHDSNHAVLYPEKIIDFSKTVLEIKAFYLEKGLVPRIYQPFEEGYFANRKDILNQCGYGVQIYGKNKFMVLTGENTIAVPRRMNIRRITTWDQRIARDIFLPAEEGYAIAVEQKAIQKDNYYLFAGMLGDEVAAIVSFHTSKFDCTRFDTIETALKHRGHGYAREMLRFAVEYCREREIRNCFQWPMHGTSERMCYEAGFRVAFEVEAGVAVGEGEENV